MSFSLNWWISLTRYENINLIIVASSSSFSPSLLNVIKFVVFLKEQSLMSFLPNIFIQNDCSNNNKHFSLQWAQDHSLQDRKWAFNKPKHLSSICRKEECALLIISFTPLGLPSTYNPINGICDLYSLRHSLLFG